MQRRRELDFIFAHETQPGEVVTIQWTVTIPHALDGWDVLYSTTGNDGPWLPIGIDLPPGDPVAGSIHTLEWLVPEGATTMAAIRIRTLTPHAVYESISDANFTITEALARWRVLNLRGLRDGLVRRRGRDPVRRRECVVPGAARGGEERPLDVAMANRME